MTRIKLVILACTSFMLSTFAFADTVNVTTKVDFVTPAHSTSSTASYAFTPSAPIVFKVAGKECTWVSSSSPFGSGGGKGCNYSITLDSSGKLTNATSNGNGCTASGDAMINACK
ncbi:hypothetical protein [uncultured Shewanella sp.]|uniref:hypothetical protein n=1 Tax=uncultured Shewanella sp. TaxID=173975 RepID=UPI0026078AF8|nr:hypothetical protein [uncultured Shewanella sp.]